MHDMRRMVALGIESGRKREHVGGTKLHTKATGFATLDDNRDTSFCHEISTLRVVETQPRIWGDYAFQGVGLV
jgi:hypothetical protein